jgi:cytoskeleton-associated protein 5
MMIDHIKTCLESTNAPTKTAATKVLVVMRISLGPSLSDFLSDVKKQLLDAIEKEFDKVKDAKPNPPTRTFRESVRGGGGGGAAGELPRTDISAKIKEKLLKDLGDNQWKTRQTALEQIEAIVLEANRRIEPKLGSLMGCMCLFSPCVCSTTIPHITFQYKSEIECIRLIF